MATTAKTKRMSLEEKRQCILGIYHSTKSVYTEKEIVALACQAGVNANTCADVNTSLVDDGLVTKEKIGGANYFWSFPTKKDYQAQVQHEKNLAQLAELEKAQVAAKEALRDAQRGRDPLLVAEEDDGKDKDGDTTMTDKAKEQEETVPRRRADLLARLAAIRQERATLQAELDTLSQLDPQSLAELQKELTLVTQAAHRWTDNLWNCESYLVHKKNMEKKQVQKFLGMPADFDYPEDKIPK